MTNPEFIYTTYIKTTPEKVWTAITKPEFCRQYWGNENISDWKKGSEWKHINSADKNSGTFVCGEVLETNPPTRLVISWVAPEEKNDKAAHSRVTFDIEPIGDVVRLTVTHDKLIAGSEMASKISQGWPRVLSNMKTFLETGKAFDMSQLKGCSSKGEAA
jgi:uncharacterized protein YndB with AHSA1/START domain